MRLTPICKTLLVCKYSSACSFMMSHDYAHLPTCLFRLRQLLFVLYQLRVKCFVGHDSFPFLFYFLQGRISFDVFLSHQVGCNNNRTLRNTVLTKDEDVGFGQIGVDESVGTVKNRLNIFFGIVRKENT